MSTITLVSPAEQRDAIGPRSLVVLKWLLYAGSVVTALLALYGLLATINLTASDAALRATLAFVAPQLSNLLIQLVQSFLIPASLVVTFLFAVNSVLLFTVGKLLAYLSGIVARVATLEAQQA